MIAPDWVRLMARYNAWQNGNIVGTADTLTDEARREDRGAFFGSIHGTLSHLLWADGIWMSRFQGGAAPPGGIGGSATLYDDWADYRARRDAMDARMGDWAAGVSPMELEGDLAWFSGALQRDVSKPRTLIIAHMFNHQTHHRGQVHAMLTAAGVRPGDTDLFILPEAP